MRELTRPRVADTTVIPTGQASLHFVRLRPVIWGALIYPAPLRTRIPIGIIPRYHETQDPQARIQAILIAKPASQRVAPVLRRLHRVTSKRS
jgi:hypothetical protein